MIRPLIPILAKPAHWGGGDWYLLGQLTSASGQYRPVARA